MVENEKIFKLHIEISSEVVKKETIIAYPYPRWREENCRYKSRN